MRFRPRVFGLDAAPEVGGLLARLRGRRGLVALDSAAGSPRRWSLVGFDPLCGAALPAGIAGLGSLLAGLRIEQGDEVPGPFHGGFLGALAYDLGVAGERPIDVPADPWKAPRIAGGLYVDFVVRDEERGTSWLVLGEDPGDGRPDLATRRRELLDAIGTLEPCVLEPRPTGPLVRHTPPEVHRERIERARAGIAAGDFYQANLAHRFSRAIQGDPVDLYRRLRRENPAPYMGFLAWDPSTSSAGAGSSRGAILSASPELLLEFDGETARTRPIKGTARRGETPEEDQRLARGLLESAKDHAELAMIVDLERNDLGRVCEPGSVRVERHAHLETYATVHHLTADVVGRPRAGVDAVTLLAALFPGGSITGAPKLAAMEAIARLEGEGRGFFTGSLGFLDLRGRAAFNILIRTMVCRPEDGRPDGGCWEVSFHVGGGITWSSDARAEDEETLVKGAALARALEAEPVGSSTSRNDGEEKAAQKVRRPPPEEDPW